MNTTLLNAWGDQALQFAWPMFWQSSLLILILFALDFVTRRRVRPSVRYAFWFILFLKLLLPPSLALPTSAAWWFRSPTRAPAPIERARAGIQSDITERSNERLTATDQSSAASLSVSARLLLLSVVVSAGLMGFMLVRGKAPGSAGANLPVRAKLEPSLSAAKQQVGLRWNVRLRVIEHPASPAAAGLLRPIILLPRLLLEQLSPLQLRAVLLHELFHFKRRDIWVNSLQSLLQVIYWWHPLLWLANTRVRRLREEAVDDAVLVVLRDAAPEYAAALVRVARLAVARPSPSLGMIGMLQPKKPLHHRVERLLTSTPPKRAGLSLLSLAGIVAFSAAAVPMARAPGKLLQVATSNVRPQSQPNSTPATSEVAVPSASTANESESGTPLQRALGSPPDPASTSLPQPSPADVTGVSSQPASPAQIPEAVTPDFPAKTAWSVSSQDSSAGPEERLAPPQPSPEKKAANAPPPEPPAPAGDPMLPQILPWVIQQDLEHLRARIHSIMPPIMTGDESSNRVSQTMAHFEPPGLKRALSETRRATTNFGVHMAGRVNTVLYPLVRIHNKATEIGLIPRFLAIGPPAATSTNSPPERRVPLLGDLPVLGRLFQLPPKTAAAENLNPRPSVIHSPKDSE